MNKPLGHFSIIREHDCPIVPWKNGMGMTREIAVQPSESAVDDFLWRVSVAEVNSAAPFSSFPGIDRHIVLLDGAGFTMTLDDDRMHPLDTPFVPFAFAGESTVAVTLIDGSTRDFNLMVRRTNASGDVDVLHEPGVHWLDATTVLLYVARGAVETRAGTLQAGDSLRVAETASGSITVCKDAVVLVIRIRLKA